MVMKMQQQRNRGRAKTSNQGFSLIETLVGSIILFLLLYSTNRTITLGMSSSRQAGERGYVESDILNDIERIRMVDDRLNKKANIRKSCELGGSNGAQHLMQEVQKNHQSPNSQQLTRKFDTTDPRLLQVIYNFTTPGSNQRANSEKRILEIHPSFLAQCS